MKKIPWIALLALLLLCGGQAARAEALDPGLTDGTVTVRGAKLYYVRGGSGPTLLLVHGFPQDWSEYQPIIARLARQFSVVAVDLRGIGRSSVQAGGYDAATMADDLHQLATQLKLTRVFLVGHDIGGQVTYALLRKYPQMLRGAMILDSPIAGLAGWDEFDRDPKLWHPHFMQEPDLPEKLVTGRSAVFLRYFFKFGKFSEAEMVRHTRAYSTPSQLHAAFEIYRAFPANTKFNQERREPIDVPLFFGAGEKSPFAPMLSRMAEDMRAHGVTNVTTFTVPNAVHYLVQDNPDAVAAAIEQRAAP